MNDPLQARVGLFVVLLLVGSAVAVIVRFVPVPYETILAVTGLVAGIVVGPGELPNAGGDLILFVLLPGLLFDPHSAWSGRCCDKISPRSLLWRPREWA